MELSVKYRNGGDKAFELIFRKYYARLCGFANKFIGNPVDSEEIVQEVFLKVWKNKDQFKFDDKIRPFLFKSVQNSCLNYIEHQKVVDSYNEVLINVYKDTDKVMSAYDMVVYSEMQGRIDSAVESLPKQCRRIFRMSRQDGLKYVEIASELDISIKTVETQMSRALAKLKVELKDYIIFLIVSFLSV